MYTITKLTLVSTANIITFHTIWAILPAQKSVRGTVSLISLSTLELINAIRTANTYKYKWFIETIMEWFVPK